MSCVNKEKSKSKIIMSSFKIRKAKESEIDSFIEWGNNSGWNMGAACTKNFHKEFPHGWFVGEINEGPENNKQKIISKLYCTKYSTNIGFIGYFMVQNEFRAQGYGYQLFKYVLDNYLFPKVPEVGLNSFGSCEAVGLFSAQTAESYYQKFGFKSVDKAIRFKGFVNPVCLKNSETEGFLEDVSFVTDTNLEQISQFDQKFSQVYRPGFWKNWGTLFPKEFCIVLKGQDGTLQGIGAIRPLPEGHRLGPIYAQSFEIAEKIFKRLCSLIPQNEMIILDVLSSNTKAVKFYREVGLVEVLQTCYMWKGNYPQEIMDRVCENYAVASLDFN